MQHKRIDIPFYRGNTFVRIKYSVWIRRRFESSVRIRKIRIDKRFHSEHVRIESYVWIRRIRSDIPFYSYQVWIRSSLCITDDETSTIAIRTRRIVPLILIASLCQRRHLAWPYVVVIKSPRPRLAQVRVHVRHQWILILVPSTTSAAAAVTTTNNNNKAGDEEWTIVAAAVASAAVPEWINTYNITRTALLWYVHYGMCSY